MKKQIFLQADEEVEIFIEGKKVLTIDQVTDDETINCYLYSDCFQQTSFDLAASGCFGELLADRDKKDGFSTAYCQTMESSISVEDE